MSDDEFDRAQDTVATVRGAICKEMANLIQHRHAELIGGQYQTLDAKTGM
jgi:hypothetical protein